MAEPILAAVLAGGQSRRFGRDKAQEPVLGHPSLERVVAAARAQVHALVVLGGEGPLPPGASARLGDPDPGGGPLQALAGAFDFAPGHAVLLLPCDAPFLPPALLGLLCAPLAPHLARIPVLDGRDQLATALYAPAAASHARSLVAQGRRSLRALVAALEAEGSVLRLGEAHMRAAGTAPEDLRDFDTPAELRALLSGREPLP